MAPKRKAAPTKAPSRKKADPKAAPVAEDVPASDEEMKSDNPEAELVSKKQEEESGDNNGTQAEPKDEAPAKKNGEEATGDEVEEDKSKSKDKAEPKGKAKGKGRKKKEAAVPPASRRVTRANPGPKQQVSSSDELPDARKRKKKEPAPKPEADDEKEDESQENVAVEADIIIEHCKSCTGFKAKAQKFESELKEANPNLKIVLNPPPVKPKRGFFEIRDAAGKIFASVQDNKKPYKILKALDLEATVKDIQQHIQQQPEVVTAK